METKSMQQHTQHTQQQPAPQQRVAQWATPLWQAQVRIVKLPDLKTMH